jgi:hypothetical protein
LLTIRKPFIKKDTKQQVVKMTENIQKISFLSDWSTNPILPQVFPTTELFGFIFRTIPPHTPAAAAAAAARFQVRHDAGCCSRVRLLQ